MQVLLYTILNKTFEYIYLLSFLLNIRKQIEKDKAVNQEI